MENSQQIDFIFLDLTEKCNQNCKFCYAHNSIDDIDLDLVEFIFSEMYINKINKILYLGGEPTLHKHFSHIIDLGNKFNFIQTVITNGQFLSEYDIKFLSKIPQLSLGLSIHSYKQEIHDYLVGKNGSLNKILYLITLLNKYFIKWFAQLSLTKYNYLDLLKIHNFLTDKGCSDRLDLSRLVPIHPAQDDLFLNDEDYINVFAQINAIDITNLKIRIECFPRCWLKKISKDFGLDYLKLKSVTRPCQAYINQISIGVKGHIRLCPTGGPVLAKLYPNNLKSLLECSQELAAFKKFRFLDTDCLKCEDFQYCYGGCKMSRFGYAPSQDIFFSKWS